MDKKFISTFIVAVFALILVRPVYASAQVSGYFYDKEASVGNTFTSTTLDFSLEGSGIDISGMKPGDSQTKTSKIKKEGKLDFKYNVGFSKNSGDDVLCNALQVEVKLDDLVVYSGNLSSLNITPVPAISGGQDDWEMKVSLADSSSGLRNKACSFNFRFRGWQTDSDGTWGFIDEENVSNTVATGSWTTPGEVVINEIMWMGSDGHTGDEWIELKNTTGNSINLLRWKIEKAGSGSDAITLSGTIPANGYFLLSNYQTNSSAINDSITSDQVLPSLSLDNGGEKLVLKSDLDNTIDQTPSGSWAAGNNNTDKQSMERNDDPATGWHTCLDSNCHSTTYWDTDGRNWGTPKSANLSDNDPSSPEEVIQ